MKRAFHVLLFVIPLVLCAYGIQALATKSDHALIKVQQLLTEDYKLKMHLNKLPPTLGMTGFVSGNRKLAVLFNYEPRELHRWAPSNPKKDVWANVHIDAEGKLIGTVEQKYIEQFDLNAVLRWRKKGNYGQQLLVLPESGEILAVEYEQRRAQKENESRFPEAVSIHHISAEGVIKRKLSVATILQRLHQSGIALQSAMPRRARRYKNNMRKTSILLGMFHGDRIVAFLPSFGILLEFDRALEEQKIITRMPVLDYHKGVSDFMLLDKGRASLFIGSSGRDAPTVLIRRNLKDATSERLVIFDDFFSFSKHRFSKGFNALCITADLLGQVRCFSPENYRLIYKISHQAPRGFSSRVLRFDFYAPKYFNPELITAS